MIIHKAFKFRLKPNKEQQEALSQQFGNARFVYNWGLAGRIDEYKATGKSLTYGKQCGLLPALKSMTNTEWLRLSVAQVLQQSLMDLDKAYQNFFSKRTRFPKFKKKTDKQSIRFPQGFSLVQKSIKLPKLGKIRIALHRPIEGKMKSATVSRTKSGKYFVSILCEVEIVDPVIAGEAIGIDLGLKDFAVLSTGEKIDNPKYLRKSEKKLAKAQRELSRKKLGSSNRDKQRIKVARLQEKIANQRKDFHHKLSRRLVDQFGIISLENLNVKGMVRNGKLAKSISDAGWFQFVSQVEYKAIWYGSQVEKVDRFFPSTKTCSVCGDINNDLTLADRNWICISCNTEHDRDVNAAINILNKIPMDTRKLTLVEIM